MHITTEFHNTRFIKQDGFGGTGFITTQVEFFGPRQGKHVMGHLVIIWEMNG